MLAFLDDAPAVVPVATTGHDDDSARQVWPIGELRGPGASNVRVGQLRIPAGVQAAVEPLADRDVERGRQVVTELVPAHQCDVLRVDAVPLTLETVEVGVRVWRGEYERASGLEHAMD